MTADDLRALSAAATPGPWQIWTGSGDAPMMALKEAAGEGRLAVWVPPHNVGVAEPRQSTDADLIVWLRNHADALADLIDFVKTVERPGCNNQPSCAERPPRSGLMCLPCSATQALAALDADR